MRNKFSERKVSSGTGGSPAPAAGDRLRSRRLDSPSAKPSSKRLRELSSDTFRSNRAKSGFVSFVGAGPGDPKLLTLRGREALEEADVVLYDHLVDRRILEYAPSAKHIYAGKVAGSPKSVSQKTIESLLIRLARLGKKVARLKGGDPFIFGRSGEEALAVARRNIPFEIVPGVTAGIAAPAYAGIPLTHRGLASEVMFLTAHEDPRKKESGIDWNAAGRFKGTLVLFMGIKTLPGVIRLLMKYGKRPETPVSMIQWGTTPGQKVISGTLRTIGRKAREAKIGSPAVTVIGEVNRLRKQLAWFEEKPLFGKKVLITRPRRQTSHLREILESKGASVMECPAIEIAPLGNFRVLDKIIGEINHFDWAVFTSENGVHAFFERLYQLGKDARVLGKIKIAAIGPGTKTKLNQYSVAPDLVPDTFSSAGLLKAFGRKSVLGKRFLLLRTDIAPKFLPQALRKAGAVVTETAVYRTQKSKQLHRKLNKLICHQPPDYVTFTSASTANHFFEALDGHPLKAKLISIGPETSRTIRKAGARVSREARPHTIDGLVEAILKEKSS